MIILGFESSCDETGLALLEVQPQGNPRLLAHALHTQVEMHAAFGGVVPELASRDHIRRVIPLLDSLREETAIRLADIDMVAFTRGPGLAGALLVGAGFACSLAAALGRPAIGVHHLEGHLLSPFLSSSAPGFPFVALLVSGGHTQLMRVEDVGHYALLGESIDDAAGEAFDKSAKLLGLGYPGGAALAQLAELGDAQAFQLPRPLLHSPNLDFSFAGLKTALRTQVQRLGGDVTGAAPAKLSHGQRADLAASTQEAIVDVLAHKCEKALVQTGLRRLVVAGGVGANRHLRGRLTAMAKNHRATVHYPELAYCTDNGAMIAMAAGLRWQRGLAHPVADYAFDVRPRWPLAEVSDVVAERPVDLRG